MPEPIQSSLDSQSYSAVDGASTEENAGQVCLPPVQSSASDNAGSTELLGPRAPSTPAVTSLVARFTAPTGVHPPVVPSLGHALSSCSWEIAGAALAAGGLLVPAGLAATLISGGRAAIGMGSANRCIERDEAKQIADGERANQSADCERIGAIGLRTADDGVICAKP
jgi:hypothetical protein